MKESGLIFVDGREVAGTHSCVHCGRVWRIERGSGKKRGWCMSCHGVTCGGEVCDSCIPYGKRLELYEKGLLHSL